MFIYSSLEGEVHYSAEEAVKFIEDRITEESKSSRHLRGPHLAKLELIRRLRHQGFNDEYKLGKKLEWCLGTLEKIQGCPHTQVQYLLSEADNDIVVFGKQTSSYPENN